MAKDIPTDKSSDKNGEKTRSGNAERESFRNEKRAGRSASRVGDAARRPERGDLRKTSEIDRLTREGRMRKNQRVLGSPRMEGFEHLSPEEKKDLQNFIDNEIPDRHLNNIDVTAIRYHDHRMKDFRGQPLKGSMEQDRVIKEIWSGPPDKVPKEMHLYKTESAGAKTEAIKDNVAYFAGKQAFSKSDALTQAEWKKTIGKVNPFEAEREFAEAYRTYKRQPHHLKSLEPEKYRFMKEKVFRETE